MKNARQENRENYLVFVQCGSDQMGCGDRSSGKIRDAMKSSRNPGGNIKRLPDMECGLLCSSVQ